VFGTDQTAQDALKEALEILSKVSSSPEKALTAAFVDGSNERKTHRGGCAVVYYRYAPGRKDDGLRVEKAWSVSPNMYSDVTEGMAIAEAIRAFVKDLRCLASEDSGDGPEVPMRRITIVIFSDSASMLSLIENTQGAPLDRDLNVRHKLLGIIVDESRKLASIPGFETRLELR